MSFRLPRLRRHNRRRDDRNDDRRDARARNLAVAVALTTTAALVSACGGDASAGSQDETVIKLVDPGNAGLLAYAKKTGILEERLEAADARVEWGGSYGSFTATIDAVRSADVTLLEGAISPVIGYLSTSKDVKIFAVADRSRHPKAPVADGLVVQKDSPITAIEQLVGKKVAVNKGGRGEYLLGLALDKAGVAQDKVEKVYLNPVQAAGAFQSGKVDAWWAIVRGYPTAVAAGAKTLVTSNEVDDDDLTMLAARTELVDENPEALKIVVDTLAELRKEANADPAKLQNVFTDSGPTATSGAALERDTEVDRYANPFRPVEDADLATIQTVADYFADHDFISKPVKASDAAVQLGS